MIRNEFPFANVSQQSDGSNYAPVGKPKPVVQAGEFIFAAAFLEHGHIHGQCNGLLEAGATLRWVYDSNPEKVEAFRTAYPQVRVARDFDEILSDPAVRLVAAAAVPSRRGEIGCRVMHAGKDYFTDKAPFTTFEQLAEARRVATSTRQKYAVYYSGRLHTEANIYAGELIHRGAIGRVLQVTSLGPHRLNKAARPAWFFKKASSGGILCDLGSHLCEQFLFYSGAQDAIVLQSAVANHANPDTPELEDFGEVSFLGDNGATNYQRVDWFTPAGLSTWGDARTIILGTTGYIETRAYLDVGHSAKPDNVILVDERGEHAFNVAGQVGFPYFGELVLDCLERSEKAMTQEHTFKAAELCLRAQAAARVITKLS